MFIKVSINGESLMNVTPELKRVGRVACALVFGFLVVGCAGTQPAAVQVDGLYDTRTSANTSEDFQKESVHDVSLQQEGYQTVSLKPQPVRNVELASRELVSSTKGNPGLKFRQGTVSEEIIISSIKGMSRYEVLRLENPARLVLDIFDVKNDANRSFELPESAMISGVRVGVHEDKSRIVMDLKSDYLDHEVSNNSQGLIVSLGQANPISEATASTDAIEHKVEMLAPVTEKVTLSGPPSEVEMASELARELSDIPALASLRIEDVGNDNMVIAQMTAGGAYTLSRTAPSEHVLRLMNAEMGAANTSAVLATPGIGQIRAVRPVKEGKDLLLRIFASPTAELKAEARGARIVVSARGARDGDSRMDPLAQLEPDGEASDEVFLASPEAAPAGMETDLGALLGDDQIYTGRLISLDLQDTDIDNALRIIAEVSNLNIIASSDVTGKVTLRLIDVPWDQALDVILKTNGLDKVQEGNVVRIAPVEKLRQEREALRQARRAEEELEPLQVRYIRISYAKAGELRPLVETVLTERGTVTYDDRTNQLIVKDIRSGIRNVAELVTRLDLRTPQVLLETQIVEAQRSLMRDLGAEVGFDFVRSPATGNATGYNFPNAIGGALGSSFAGAAPASASFLFDSADGSMSLDARMTALEEEGRVRVISRPAVATTNNRPAEIRSVEKIRVRTPSGGSTVAVGQGGTAAGTGTNATETIEIGITLSVTPQASPDYFVLLDVDAKSSSFGTQEVDGIPSEVERSATSTILVSSGQTFAMGGIYRITDIDSVAGVPFFKDIPFLGHLFRNTTVNNSDEELLFFITPRIIEGSFDDAAMRSAS